MAALCVAACLVLALPLSASATAVLDRVGIEVGPERTGYLAAHDDLVAYTAYRDFPEAATMGSFLVVGDALTGDTILDKGTSQLPEIGGFDGDWIAYRAGDMSEAVFAMNVHTGENILLDETGVVEVTVPLVDSGRVVWGKRPYGSNDPWTYKIRDLSTGQTQVITTSSYTFSSFKGDLLSYSTPSLAGGLDLRVLDFSKSVSVIVASNVQKVYDYQETWPYFVLTDNSAVWATIDATGSELFRCDLDTLTTSSLTKTNRAVGSLSADERLVAWSEVEGTDSDVIGLDMETGSVFTVAAGSGYQSQPSVAGMRIAYSVDAVVGNNGDIYSATLSYTMPDLGKVSAPKQAKVGAQAKLSAAFSNPDKSDTATVVWDFGDGATETFDVGASGRSRSSHAYATAGTYEGSVTITDASGMKDVAKFTVVVR